MNSNDKAVHIEEKINNEPATAPTTANPVAECEMDALLLGRIGVSKNFLFNLITAIKECEEFQMSGNCSKSDFQPTNLGVKINFIIYYNFCRKITEDYKNLVIIIK